VNTRDYFFVSASVFAEMVEKNAFLEHATVYENAYGTSRAWVHEQLLQGIDVILEIDWQGAQQIKKLFPSAVLVFILPPSIEALKARLQGRGQDDAQTIARRMQVAQDEMSHFGEFDYLVVNDQFSTALGDLKNIVIASRFKIDVQRVKQATLLEDLLKKQ
jgi:guanylate kinase